MPPRKSKEPPRVGIGAFPPPAPLAAESSREDERAFDRIGSRAAGEGFDISPPSKAQTHGTHERPRFRVRDQSKVRTTTVHIKAEVLRRARVLCAARDLTLSKLVELQLEAALLEDAERKVG